MSYGVERIWLYMVKIGFNHEVKVINYYIRNAQGDIIGLIDSNGNKVVSYIYDTWGN